jgi:hypothetical protein
MTETTWPGFDEAGLYTFQRSKRNDFGCCVISIAILCDVCHRKVCTYVTHPGVFFWHTCEGYGGRVNAHSEFRPDESEMVFLLAG